MQSHWLTKRNNASCILFFTGWGMAPAPFEDIPVQNHDLLLIYDYSKLDKIIPSEITGDRYDHLHLVAWSMGVWAAATMLDFRQVNFASTLAINGTLTPIDDTLGIENAIYNEMMNNFTPDSLHDFYISMFTEREEADRFCSNRPERSQDDLLAELTALRNSYLELGPAPDIYNRKLVSSRDRVFPARSQLRAWGRDNSTLLKAGHFPFYGSLFWDTLLIEKTGDR